MKRILIIFLALLICFPTAFARKKKKRSGTIEKNVYTDAAYNFKLTLAENWKRQLQKPKSNFRIVLNQKDYKIPPDLMQYPNLAEVPELKVYMCQESMPPGVYVDSLTSEEYSTKTKKELLQDLLSLKELVIFTGLKKISKSNIKIDGKRAVKWVGTSNYINDLGMGESDPRTFSFAIVCVQNGENMLVFTLSTEVIYFPEILEEAMKMIESLKWEG